MEATMEKPNKVMSVMSKEEAYNILYQETEKWLRKAEGIYNRKWDMPVISLKLKGAVAGRAWGKKWFLKFNYDLFVMNQEDFLKRTVPHELAHILVYELYKKISSSSFVYGKVTPHGNHWKRVMMDLGVDDITRCHEYDVSKVINRRKRVHIYTCDCREHQITNIIHNRMMNGRTYHCKKCKKNIVYKGEA